jgi:hypothetical protein
MVIDKDIEWSLAEVVKALGGQACDIEQAGVVTLVANDRLFMGGGCEAPLAITDGTHPNVSVCSFGPTE